MNEKQAQWWTAKNEIMTAIEQAWHYDRTLAYNLFTADFRQQIETACERLEIKLATAWDPDGWDGEQDASIITIGRQLEAIRRTIAGEEIPEFWYVGREDEYYRRKR